MPVADADLDAAWDDTDAPAGAPGETPVRPDVPAPAESTTAMSVGPGTRDVPGSVDAAVDDFWQSDEDRLNAQTGALFESSLRKEPDRHAAILGVARQTGAPADLVEQRFDDFKRSAEAAAFDPAKWRADNPALAQLLIERPEAAPVVMRDEQLSVLGKAMRWLTEETQRSQDEIDRLQGKPVPERSSEAGPRQVPTVEDPLAQAEGIDRLAIYGAAFGHARKGLQASEAGFKALTAKAVGGDPWPHLKRAADLEAEAQPRYYGQGPVEQIGLDAVEAIASQIETLKGVGAGALAFGAAGAVVGGVATKSVSGAVQGAKAAAGFGAKAGAALASFELEAGSAYLEMSRARTDDGKPIDDTVAVGASVLAGALNAAVEVASLGPLASVYKPLGDMVKARGAKTFVREMLRERGFAGLAAEAGKHWLKEGAAEGGEEFVQQLVGDVATWAAKSLTAGTPQVAHPGESLVEAAEAATKGFVGGLALGAPGTIATLTAGAIQSGRAKRAGTRVAAINEAAKASPAAKNAPELVAQLIERETAESGEAVTHLYVDGGALTRLFQENGADPADAAVELMGPDGPKRLQEAVASGQKIEVPVAEYLERWGGKPVAEALAEHTTTRPGYLTPAELAEQDKRVQDEAKVLAEKYQAENAPAPESNAERAYLGALQQQLAATDTYTERSAKQAVALHRAAIRTLAARAGVSADELFGQYTTRVSRGQIAEVQALAQPEVRPEGPVDPSFNFGSNLAATVDVGIEQAKATIARMKPENKAMATAWLEYAQGQRTERPEITPEMERRLAAFGVVDPEGYSFDESGRDMARPLGGRKLRGEEPQALKNIRLMNRDYRTWQKTRYEQEQLFQSEDDLSPRGFVEFAREGARRLFNVALGEKADKSTFLHESGHIFLEMMGDIASREDAPSKVKEDYAAALKWLGAESRDGIQREHHEKWARAFEAYLYEGKAPSSALARAFQRFKLWLTQVYRDLTSLNVDLSDDIRGVFDRLLATDDEIARTKRAMGLQPLWASPAEAGMTPEQWQAYLASQEKATSHARFAAEHRLLKDKLRETEAWWKDEEAALQVEAEKDYENRKDIIARKYLKQGELPAEWGGQVDPSLAGGRLDRTAVEAMVGVEWGKLFRLVKEGGEHPDDVADLMGFPTGKEMLEAVISAPEKGEWTKQAALERMLQRHPDILQERDKLRELVGKGLHGEFTSDWLLKEWRALRAKAGDDAAPPVESIKAAARLIVERGTLRRVETGRAISAERSAAEKAAVAAAKGDWAQASVFKQQQLLNHYLYRELAKVAEERDAFLELAKKLASEKTRARLGKAAPAYRDGVDQVLEALGFKAVERREQPPASLGELVRVLEANAETVGFDQDQLGALLANPRSWKDLTVAEARGVVAFLKNIRQAAINRNTVLLEGKREDREKVIDELLAEAIKSLPSLGPASSSPEARTALQQTTAVVSAIDGSLLKPETLLNWMGGGDVKSTWFRALVKPLQAAKHREADLLRSTVRPIIQALEKVPEKVRARMMEKVNGRALFPQHRTDIDPPSRRFELLSLFWNMGNEGNKQRLLQGRNMTEEQALKAINLLTKEELDFAQGVMDAMESLWPLARDLEERDSGLTPEKVEATPIVARHGAYRGGYFPAVYDRRVSRTGEVQAANTLASLTDPTYTRPGTSRGHLKARAEDFADVITLSPSVVQAHLAQAAHDIAFREAVKSVGSLILSNRIQAVLKERLGDGRASQLLQWVKDAGQMRGAEVAAHTGALTRAFRGLKGNFAVGVMGWAADVALGDLSNVFVAATVLKKKHWAAGLAQFISSPIDSTRLAAEKSAEIRFRQDETTRRFSKEIRSITKKRVPKWLSWYKDHAFAFMEWTDKATSVPTWLGAYRQALADGRSDADAVTFADATLRKVFPSHSPIDQAGILRDKGLWGSMTMFYGYFSTVYNLNREFAHEVHVASGGVETAKAVARASGKMMALGIITGAMAELLSGRGPEPDDGDDEAERWATWLARKTLLAPVQAVPLPIASTIESFILHKRPSMRAAPGFAAFETLGKAVYKAVESESADDAQKALEIAKALGLLFGVPTRPLRAVRYLYDASQGEAPAESPADVASGLLYGYREGQPENPLTIGSGE